MLSHSDVKQEQTFEAEAEDKCSRPRPRLRTIFRFHVYLINPQIVKYYCERELEQVYVNITR